MSDTVTPIGLRVRPDGTVEGALIPPGVVIHTAADNAPVGWLVANGQAVSRATYPDLFAAIGTRYGAGDGVTTFNVPNLTDRFIRGDTSPPVGGGGGADTHQHATHHHQMSFATDPAGGIGVRVAISANPADPFAALQTHAHNFTNFPNTGDTQTDVQPNVPVNVALLPIIKT